MPRFNVGLHMKKKKEMKQEMVNRKRDLVENRQKLEEVNKKVQLVEKDLGAKQHKRRRLDEKVEKVVREIEDLEEIHEDLTGCYCKKKNIKNPTDLDENGNITTSVATARNRRQELYAASGKINGASKKSKDIGLADTIVHKSDVSTIAKIFKKHPSFTKKLIKLITKDKVDNFESSNNNMLRSVATYYNGGVMGKRKYRSIYKTTSYKNRKRMTIHGCPITRLVPYHKLMPFIKGIDIGKTYSVRETLCEGLEEDCKVNGVYRSLEDMLLRLAKFYLEQSVFKLTWFNGEINTFYVAIGGDGAPFGKDDVSTSWLISILNLGRGVLSSSENFLLFGANCPETAIPVTRFVKALVTEISKIESSTYNINVNHAILTVKFYFSELPNDMKMLAFLAGELSNSAKYFSTFGNANYDNCNNLDASFSSDPCSTWHPWTYKKRLQVAQEVTNFKSKQPKNLAKTTLRNKITTFIAAKQSRQEFSPLIGKLVDRAHVEPLHLKNNACALAHRLLLTEVMKLSNVSQSVNFSQLPNVCPLVKYVSTMSSCCKLRRLSKKIIKWFDETKSSSSKTMDYRFTGKDSKAFLHNFNVLILCLIPCTVEGTRARIVLHVISYMCLCLRNCVSLFNRLTLTDAEVENLKTLCHHYLCLNKLFLSSVNPTVWHIAHIVPFHTKEMIGKYGMGLFLNSMEGREAKHQSIANYSKNTIYKHRWEQIFLHEYISLIWLRERGYNWGECKAQTTSYVPKCTEDPGYCSCGIAKNEDGKCQICDHPYHKQIEQCILLKKSLFKEAGKLPS